MIVSALVFPTCYNTVNELPHRVELYATQHMRYVNQTGPETKNSTLT